MKTFKLIQTNGRTLSNCHINQYTTDDRETWSDLISYTTRVASYNHNTNQISIYNCQSNTTHKHINHFLEFYGFDKKTKKELTDLI